jgi:CheY-like chemotaxis protein
MPDPIRVLFGEDGRLGANAVRARLAQAPEFAITVVPTAAAIRQRLAGEPFDVLPLDATLPDADAVALLAALRADGRAIPALLRRQRARPRRHVRRPPADHRSAGGSETILVVEDEEPVRRPVHRLLERGGYTVLVAADGAAAIETWQQLHAAIDLVITDIVIPRGLAGPELATRLGELRPDVPVLFVSGYPGDTVGANVALREGLNFVRKPFAIGDLLRCVRSCIDLAKGRTDEGARALGGD